MPLSALALVIAAAIIHATWNFYAKRAGGDARFGLLSCIFLMIFWAPLGIYMGWQVVPTWGRAEWWLMVCSAFAHVGYYVFLLKGYRVADLTVVYPVARGSGPVLSATFAILWMGESLTPLGLAGLLGVVCGVFLIAGGAKIWQRATDAQNPDESKKLKAGLIYGVVTGLWIASYTAIDGYAVKFLLINPILLDYMSNFIRIPLYLPLIWKDRHTLLPVWKTYWKPCLFVAVAGSIGYTLVLYAVQLAPLSHVAPAREVSMLFAALIGGHLLGEGDRKARIAGACLIALGVAALTF
ncbi:MAG: EamA family transporter [Cytophagales bacterium]|nr:EamA family transporter [Cytophagales bacterium]